MRVWRVSLVLLLESFTKILEVTEALRESHANLARVRRRRVPEQQEEACPGSGADDV